MIEIEIIIHVSREVSIPFYKLINYLHDSFVNGLPLFLGRELSPDIKLPRRQQCIYRIMCKAAFQFMLIMMREID